MLTLQERGEIVDVVWPGIPAAQKVNLCLWVHLVDIGEPVSHLSRHERDAIESELQKRATAVAA